MKISALFWMIIFLAVGPGLLACDYCLLTQGISPLETSHGFGFRIDERYTRLSTLTENRRRIPNPDDEIETHWTTQLTGFYSVTPRLTLTAVVPVARRFGRESEIPLPDAVVSPMRGSQLFSKSNSVSGIQHEGGSGSSFGLSDITVLGRFQLLQRHTLTSTLIAALQAGVRLPTGKTDRTNDEGEVLEAHIQPGTGAFNYLFGLSGNYVNKRIGVSANAVVSLATQGEVGRDSYEFGDALNYDTSLRYRLNGSAQAPANVFAAVGLAGEYRGREYQDGLEVHGTGGHTLYLTPGFQISAQPFTFEISFWQAIARRLNGRQLGETFKTFAGITYLIN